MKKGKLKKLTAAGLAAMLGMLCACIRTDYKEIAEFPPLPKDIKVVTYYDRSQFPVPEKEQVLVGDASASAYTSSYTLNDIKRKLTGMARRRGANAVLILSIDHKLSGQVRTDQVKNLSGPTWTPIDDSSTDSQQQRYMDLYSRSKDGELPVYKITIEAKFYKLPDEAVAANKPLLRESSGPAAPPPANAERREVKETEIRIHNR